MESKQESRNSTLSRKNSGLFLNFFNSFRRKFSKYSATDGIEVAAEANSSFYVSEVMEVPWAVDRDSPEYNMNFKYRGKAVIFNHEKFVSRHSKVRYGTRVDVQRLESTLKKLGFDVKVCNDLELQQIKTVWEDLRTQSHHMNDCFMCFVLTHGMNGHISARDAMYPVETLWQNFTAQNCPSLAGKPKLFFINTCRGPLQDRGVIHVTSAGGGGTETDSVLMESYKLPNQADFLIAQSCRENFASHRNPETGTWYVQSLCEVLEERHETTDLLKILTIAARNVAMDYESVHPRPELNGMKQTPIFTSMLTRAVYFRPKDAAPSF